MLVTQDLQVRFQNEAHFIQLNYIQPALTIT